MKKPMFLVLLCFIVFVGTSCGQDVNQEEYDKLAKTNSELSKEIEDVIGESTSDKKQNNIPAKSSKKKVSLVKIKAKYNGSAKAGTVLDDNNTGISVLGIYSDETTKKIHKNKFEIKKPVTLKAGKTSIVKITYNGKKCNLKVKCTTKKKHRKGKDMIGVSNKDIYDIDGKFHANKVRNDVTGNWRISAIAANADMVKYAKSYYKWKFHDDDEIHGIVNFNDKTTTKISVMGKILDVTVQEYVSGEEHDANLLFSGTLLNEYHVYLDNGDIKKIQ